MVQTVNNKEDFMHKSIIKFTFAVLLIASSSNVVMAQENEDGRRYGNFCSSCHGTAGAAVSDAIPSIGGQHKDFLITSMLEMKPTVVDGKEQAPKRYSTLMQIFFKGYSEDEIKAMADWYSSKPWVPTNYPLNQDLVNKGKTSANLETCTSCHGTNGNNIEDTGIPRIGGQTPTYLYHALLEYKNNKRNKDGRALEMDVVKEISDEELRALAEYFSSLR